MGTREIFCRRMDMELQLFRESLFKESGDVVYGSSYKIEVFVNLYEILAGLSDGMAEETMENIMQEGSGMLETLYQGWLKREDSFYAELEEYVCSMLAEKKAWKGKKAGKGDSGYGKECDTAA